MKRCPRCDSPAPHLHPAIQWEGEVQPCAHKYHHQVTASNTAKLIAQCICEGCRPELYAAPR